MPYERHKRRMKPGSGHCRCAHYERHMALWYVVTGLYELEHPSVLIRGHPCCGFDYLEPLAVESNMRLFPRREVNAL